MAVLGRACLIIAFVVALYGIGASVYGARAGRHEWADSGRRAVYALAGLMTVVFAILEIAFLRSDFSFNVVATHSSTTTPTFYKAAAMWSSQEGSLVLWVWLLSLWSSLVLLATRKRARELAPYATAVLLGFGAFFLMLVLFWAPPFQQSSPAPLEGTGLNPLLRHPSMMFHPPMLYSGYTLFTIPLAFAIAALITGKLDTRWISLTRRFALLAWLCLGTGVLLGARWSYVELGWGGYWGWDPVENAALLPWLTGTAFLHSVMLQEKRGMLKVWNVSLVLATGTLAILGTFLVRSGVLESIHAFGASTLGVPFIILIGLLVAASVGLVTWRRASLRSEHRLDALMSREAVFLFNNLVLVGLAFVVFWGTFFPLISEAVTGTKSSLGPPWFDRYTVPLALVLVLLSGIGPVLAWRGASAASLRRNLGVPAAVALVVLAALLALTDAGRKPAALVMFALGAFVITAVGQEFWRGTHARHAMSGEPLPLALGSLVRRNRRRYGGYVVHAGIAILFIGVAASSALGHTRDVRMSPGQSTRIDGYDVRYVRPTASLKSEKVSFGALLDVRKDGRSVATLRPSRSYFPSADGAGPVSGLFDGEPTSEVGLQAGLRRDLWTAMSPDLTSMQGFIADADRRFPNANGAVLGLIVSGLAQRYLTHTPPATFRVIVSPLVTWIWLGALIVFCGALLALWPAPAAVRRRVRAGAHAARLADDLGHVRA